MVAIAVAAVVCIPACRTAPAAEVVRVDIEILVAHGSFAVAACTDSRTFGPVPADLILGKVWFRY